MLALPPPYSGWVQGVLQGDRRALAKAATAIENRHPAAVALLEALYPSAGKAVVTGITGPPGAGKSTLVDGLACHHRRAGKQVAVIAVDPSSPFTGGALLGDRIRMQRHATDPGVFIRSMASRGNLGGLAAATTEIAILLDAAGFDRILIETVGVGQEEVDIAQMAHVTAVLLVPGLGDDVQALKAGILEVADLFVINKADRPGAGELEQQLRAALSLSGKEEAHQPPIFRTVASTGEGLEDLVAALEGIPDEELRRQRSERLWRSRLPLLLRDRLIQRFPSEEFVRAARDIAHHGGNPFTYVARWLETHCPGFQPSPQVPYTN